jgi:hypothetical protein
MEIRSQALRDVNEIDQCNFKPSGNFWPDLQNLVEILGAKPHPCFIPGHKNRFFAISYKFDEFSFAILCKVLATSPIKQVGFNNANLQTIHITYLLKLILIPTFQNLQIDWNPIESPLMFSELLNNSSKLQSLSLRSSGINNEAFAAICENLKDNRVLKSLDLYGNFINDLIPLGGLLNVNRTLSMLSLSGNQLTDECLEPLLGAFGKILYSQEEVEVFKKKQKDNAKKKIQFSDKKLIDAILEDEIYIDDDTNQSYLLKNQVFNHFNLSLNKFTGDHYLRLVLSQATKNFKILISGNLFPESLKNSLTQAFPNNLII